MTLTASAFSTDLNPYEELWRLNSPDLEQRIYCKRCTFHNQIPGVTFDEKGVCNLCRTIEPMEAEYPTGDRGQARLEEIAKQMKKAGKNKDYDVVVGLSGGCDSSYLLYKLKTLGLRPLAAHFDNTWGSDTSTHNIRQMTKSLGVDLFTVVANNRDFDRIIRAFFRSRIIALDCVTDLAFTTTMYMGCEQHKVAYQADGHSFRTEGISPAGYAYFDSRFVADVVRKNGGGKIGDVPTLYLHQFLRYMLLLNLKRVRPIYFMDYNKEQVKRFLTREFGWRWYGGHHLEDRVCAFAQSFLQPYTLGADQRVNGFAAMVRSGQLEREDAIQQLSQPPDYDPELIEYFKRRLDITDDEFESVIRNPPGRFSDYRNYKRVFEYMRPFFWSMYKLQKVPKSFYVKYCLKSGVEEPGIRKKS